MCSLIFCRKGRGSLLLLMFDGGGLIHSNVISFRFDFLVIMGALITSIYYDGVIRNTGNISHRL